jgi:hypothetical protein
MRRRRRNLALWEDLALAVAKGIPVKVFAAEHDLPLSTAYEWSRSEDFRAKVHEIRREVVDGISGGLTASGRTALNTLTRIARSGKTEGARLMASKTILDQMIVVANWSDVLRRLEALEAKERERSRDNAGAA